jgi:hypothetical protein
LKGRQKIKKCVEQFRSNYNFDNLFDRRVESITWIELHIQSPTPTKLYGAGMKCLNSIFAVGSSDILSSGEWSRINSATYEESNKSESSLYCHLEVGNTREYNWEEGNLFLCQKEIYGVDAENASVGWSSQSYFPWQSQNWLFRNIGISPLLDPADRFFGGNMEGISIDGSSELYSP